MSSTIKLSDFILAVRENLEEHIPQSNASQVEGATASAPKKRGRAKAAPVTEAPVADAPVKELLFTALADLDALTLALNAGFQAPGWSAAPREKTVFERVAEVVKVDPLDFPALPSLDDVSTGPDAFHTTILTVRRGTSPMIDHVMRVWDVSGVTERIAASGTATTFLNAFDQATWKLSSNNEIPTFFYAGQSSELACCIYRNRDAAYHGREAYGLILNHLDKLLSQYLEQPGDRLSQWLVDYLAVYRIVAMHGSSSGVLGSMLYKHLVASSPNGVGYMPPLDVVSVL